jgi:hypothetical protein
MLREGLPVMERVVERWRSYATTVAIVAAVAVLPQPASAATPSNDNFGDRTPITGLPFTDSVDTSEATDEGGESRPSCAPIGRTVWYEYTPATDAVLQADTLGSDFDTVIGIWEGNDLSTLSEMGCDDDTGEGVESMAVFLASAGSTYLIQVGGYHGESGALTLHVGPPTSGSISGRVTSDTGDPLLEICVEARSESDEWGGWAETTSSGAYTIGGLSDGTYHVHFYDGCDSQRRSHEAEWFDDQPTEATATGVPVTSPEAITGIDAQLTTSVLGSISGTVTSDSGEPLPDICVYVWDTVMDEALGWTETEADGSYSIGAPEGSYKVHLYDGCDEQRDHEGEWFDDATFTTATPVPVAPPQATTGIDAELTALGSISGTVTTDTGEPPSPVCVDVYDAETGDWEAWTETTPAGRYAVGVLDGSYHVTFFDCEDVTNYEREWFDDQATRATAAEVIVNGASETAGIDAELTTRVLGAISGTVTSVSGQPLGDICIDILDSATGGFAGWADATASGTYSAAVRPGNYHVEFYDCGWPLNHQTEWFDDQPTRATATEVVVTANNTTSGIDAELARSTPQTTITSGPPGLTTSTTVGFTFVSSMPGSTFECSLDGSIFAACTSPRSYSALVEGFHAFRVRAIGTDGEVDPSPAERTWVVDTSAPVLSIQRPTAGAYVNNQSVGGTGPIVVAGYVIVGVTAIDPHSGVSNFMFEVDGIPVTPFDVTRDGDIFRFTYRPGSPGNHTITARATNAAGLTSNTSISVVGVPAG